MKCEEVGEYGVLGGESLGFKFDENGDRKPELPVVLG